MVTPGAEMFGLVRTTWFGGSPRIVGPRLENSAIESVVHVVAPTENASGYRASGW